MSNADEITELRARLAEAMAWRAHLRGLLEAQRRVLEEERRATEAYRLAYEAAARRLAELESHRADPWPQPDPCTCGQAWPPIA